MKRRFRLTKTTDFKRVRRMGKSYAHPLIVLIAHPNDLDHSRFGVAAGRSLGGAVQRNRAKRRIREALRALIPEIEPGWDLVVLTRRPLQEAALQDCQEILKELLRRANMLKDPNGNSISTRSRTSS